jgi:hypothetical protein
LFTYASFALVHTFNQVFTHRVVSIVWVCLSPNFVVSKILEFFSSLHKKRIPNFLLSPQCENSSIKKINLNRFSESHIRKKNKIVPLT